MQNLIEIAQTPIAYVIYGVIFLISIHFSLRGFKDKTENPINRALILVRVPIFLAMGLASFYMAYRLSL